MSHGKQGCHLSKVIQGTAQARGRPVPHRHVREDAQERRQESRRPDDGQKNGRRNDEPHERENDVEPAGIEDARLSEPPYVPRILAQAEQRSLEPFALRGVLTEPGRQRLERQRSLEPFASEGRAVSASKAVRFAAVGVVRSRW